MSYRSIRVAAACMSILLTFPALAIAEPGDMMHMTISGKVQIANPPISTSIPAISKDVCAPKLVDVRAIVTENSHHKDCAYTNYKDEGGTVSFHYACTGDKAQVDGDGSFTLQAGGYHGTTHASVTTHGMTSVADLTYEGTRTGASCDYTPPKSAQ